MAGIRATQVTKLEASGVTTLQQLAKLEPAQTVPHLAQQSLTRLREEETALKKLSGRHSTREALLDRLLRERRLVDLYRVVLDAIRASTPSYSIKDIEKFYRGARQGDVQTAGASIVYYERYLETGDQTLLEKIERYNEDDVESTQQLHQWLLSLRPKDLRWRGCENLESGAGLPSPRLQAYLGRALPSRTCLAGPNIGRQ